MHPTGASLRPVYVTAALLSLSTTVYALGGVQPSPLASLAYTVCPLIAILVWFRRDARARRMPLAHDWGFLALSLGFVLLPWYAFATRGWRGAGLLARLAAAYLAPVVAWAVVSLAR